MTATLSTTWSACGSGDAPRAHVRTPVVDSIHAPRAVIWAVGDGADGKDPARALVARIASRPFDLLLYLGDVYDEGTRADFAAHYATTYGRLAAKTAPTPGNHDWPNRATGYLPYWQHALQRRPRSWYAFRAAGWQLLSLNSEAVHNPGSPQERWLRAELRTPGTCRIAYWHRPRYSSGSHGDQPDVAPLWDDLRGHAVIVLAGHDHDMQRFKPIDGITELVSGAGGKGHYRVQPDRRLAFANDSAYGALRLVLRHGVASYAFVTSTGRTLDRGSVSCRPLGH
jgi:hypothetical protein